MKKTLLLFAIIFCFGMRAFATTHTITVADFSFTPSSVTINLGDTVKWVWASGFHTTTSVTIPSGAATWNSNINSSTTSFIYVPTIVGTYNYECTIHSSMMTAQFTVMNSSGIKAVANAPIMNVYPNPASATLHFQFSANGSPVSIIMTDLNGKEVLKRKYKVVKDAELDIRDIPNGTYVIHAQQGNETYTQQFVIAH